MIDAAEKSLYVGARFLLECANVHDECHCEGSCEIDLALARVLLTKDNLYSHPDVIIDGCLMNLPPKYLEEVEYDESSEEFNSVRIQLRYAACHCSQDEHDEEEDNEDEHTEDSTVASCERPSEKVRSVLIVFFSALLFSVFVILLLILFVLFSHFILHV